ncbi:hypothetical protein KTS45_10395 [Halomicroarcula limicola]|uniref:Uncharacterized protein n=1 Tax=Haloarcula limicola TaxID=1429915 RepID=A0A8J7Y5T7_9EURY|nr:hypothetical protein [Halomicroarcula limicola]MBV0924607.1 hypothetical protein [Halomicroarcula limicola]
MTYGDIEVTVTDAMTSNTVTIDDNTKKSPSNGIFALFKISAHNTDVAEHDGPYVNPVNYETLEKEDGVIYRGGINDIRVFGSGEGGHLPELNRLSEYNGYELGIVGHKLETYPSGNYRPNIAANDTVSGWVVGMIKSDQTPQLKINWKGKSTMWAVDSQTDLSTPTPQGEVITL